MSEADKERQYVVRKGRSSQKPNNRNFSGWVKYRSFNEVSIKEDNLSSGYKNSWQKRYRRPLLIVDTGVGVEIVYFSI